MDLKFFFAVVLMATMAASCASDHEEKGTEIHIDLTPPSADTAEPPPPPPPPPAE